MTTKIMSAPNSGLRDTRECAAVVIAHSPCTRLHGLSNLWRRFRGAGPLAPLPAGAALGRVGHGDAVFPAADTTVEVVLPIRQTAGS
jgi:hypothetical protein